MNRTLELPVISSQEELQVPITLRNLSRHPFQALIQKSKAKRIIVRAGRRGGKTVTAATIGVDKFLTGKRVLYATPPSEQLDAWWFEVVRALMPLVDAGLLTKNETEHSIELAGTQNRIRGKTAWNADTMRGDYADHLTLDEFQLMNEGAWDDVGQPMLLDKNGDALFIYTPPSLSSQGVSRARDPRHAAKMFRKALEDKTGLWETVHFTSLDNPFISQDALAMVSQGMALASYRREILAEDDEIEPSWLVYSKFNERVCKIPRFPIKAEWPIYTGHDFGAANPAAVFLAQNPGTGDFFVFREYLPGAGFSTAQHVQVFQEIAKGFNVLRRVGGSHQEEEIRQGYGAHGWPITEPKLNRVNAQVDRVIGLMELNKVFIFEDLYHLLGDVANCIWKLGVDGKPTDEILNEQKFHCLAALRYIGSDFMPETITKRARRIYSV